MKKLYHLNISCPIRTKCYLTFIQSAFICQLCTIFYHVSKTCRTYNVLSLASSMAHSDYSSISVIYERCFKQRRLRMYATGRTPLFELEPLPSGGYRQLKCRNDLRNYCFRNSCVKLLNSILQLKILNETALMLTLCILLLLVY